MGQRCRCIYVVLKMLVRKGATIDWKEWIQWTETGRELELDEILEKDILQTIVSLDMLLLHISREMSVQIRNYKEMSLTESYVVLKMEFANSRLSRPSTTRSNT
jgi:hypothetical protein